MLTGKYKLKKKLSKGSFGKIFLASNIEGESFVIKKIRKTDKNVGRIKNDAEIPKLVNHPNIIKIIDYFETKDHAHIVYPYMDNYKVMTKFEMEMQLNDSDKIKKIANIFFQLCDVIECMHDIGIVHRDIKPENVLIVNNDKTPIIVDFDLAFVMNNDNYPSYNNICGSPGYLAPEMWEDYEDYSAINYKIGDIYSLGVMLYRILNFMKMPYDISNFENLYISILNDAPIKSDCGTEDLDDLLSSLIDKNPNNRPSLKEIKLVLKKFK